MYRLILIIVILTVSCEDNKISFNLKGQSIYSCNNKGLVRLYIRNDSIADFYKILWSKPSNAPKSINLGCINKNYKIYRGWNEINIKVSDFKLLPQSHYIVERSQGDASSFKIYLTTDDNGRILKTSFSPRLKCAPAPPERTATELSK